MLCSNSSHIMTTASLWCLQAGLCLYLLPFLKVIPVAVNTCEADWQKRWNLMFRQCSFTRHKEMLSQQDPLTDVSVVRSLHGWGEGKGTVGWSHCSYCIPALTWEKWETHISQIITRYTHVHVWGVRRSHMYTVKSNTVIHPVYVHATVGTSVLIYHR